MRELENIIFKDFTGDLSLPWTLASRTSCPIATIKLPSSISAIFRNRFYLTILIQKQTAKLTHCFRCLPVSWLEVSFSEYLAIEEKVHFVYILSFNQTKHFKKEMNANRDINRVLDKLAIIVDQMNSNRLPLFHIFYVIFLLNFLFSHSKLLLLFFFYSELF